MSILMGRKGFQGIRHYPTHSYTKNIEEITVQADIIITALGVPNYLKAKYGKEGRCEELTLVLHAFPDERH
jgi:methylenetetrahydrofolate dehydrogenase (NADP+)/methenyltetrahydrofolate cyclohydrolase